MDVSSAQYNEGHGVLVAPRQSQTKVVDSRFRSIYLNFGAW
jgi:hypothetical protein